MKKDLLKGLLLSFFALSFLSVQAQTDGQDLEVKITTPENIAASYEWRGATDFGGEITSDLCGDLVWAGMPEELGCEPLDGAVDLTGKIAMVRRGDCFFSLKVYSAEQAGAEAVVIVNHPDDPDTGLDGLIGMSGADSAAAVTVPSIFLSYNTSELINSALEGGEAVELCMVLPRFNMAFGPYSYSTPQSQIVPLENMQVRMFNRTLDDFTDIESMVVITDPNGVIDTIKSIHSVPQGEFFDVTFDSYTPEAIGEYNMEFISGSDGRAIERKFEITENTWAIDNGIVDRDIGPSAAQFEEAIFEYQHANLLLTGADAMATHITFGVGNGAELFTNDEVADLILLAVYDADKDEDGQIDDFTDFAGLGDPVGLGLYQLTGEETFDDLITVALDEPVALRGGGAYYVSIYYSGLDAATGVGPRFSATGDPGYLNFPTTPLYLNELFSGWAGAVIVTRLHLEGFTSVKDIQPLSADKLTILSNPVQYGQVRYELELGETSKTVDIMFRDLNGKLLNQSTFNNVSRLSESINTKDLPAGTYFLNVNTDEGFRSEKILIIE